MLWGNEGESKLWDVVHDGQLSVSQQGAKIFYTGTNKNRFLRRKSLKKRTENCGGYNALG